MARDYPVKITPRCRFSWAHLHEPDRKYQTDGEYNVTCILDADDPLLAEIEAIRDEFYPMICEQEGKKITAKKPLPLKQAPLPFKTEEDEEGEETGNVTIRPKAKALVRYKRDGEEKSFTFRPDIVDSSGIKPVREPVGGGSEGKVRFEVVPWYTAMLGMGVTLRLKAVQVLELVPFGGNNLEGFEQEDGFVAEDSEDLVPATTDEKDGDF